jgi:hypothetical protein
VLDALPEGFKAKFAGDGKLNVGNVAKSYGEAETALTAARQPAEVDPLSIKSAAGTNDQSLDQVLASAGLTQQSIAEEFTTNQGQLTSETYAKLPYPRAVVDMFMKATVAEASLAQRKATDALSEAQSIAGGDQALQSLLGWAGRSGLWNEEQLGFVDKRLHDPLQVVGAVTELRARHQEAMGAGNAQPLISGSSAPGVGTVQVTRDNAKQLLRSAKRGNVAAQHAIGAAANTGDLTKALL